MSAKKLAFLPVENFTKKYRPIENGAKLEPFFKDGMMDLISSKFPMLETAIKLNNDEFKIKYRDLNKPVIVKGLIDDWRALKIWNFDYLKEMCGEAKIVMNHYFKDKSFETTFADFVNQVKANMDEDPLYLQEWPILAESPQLAKDIKHLSIRDYDCRSNLYGATTMNLWIGQKNGVTPLHRDFGSIDVINAQVVGQKHWILFGPNSEIDTSANVGKNLENFVNSSDSVILHAILSPGDVIFLPAGWYHRIQLIDNCIGLGLQVLDEKNMKIHMHAKFQELLPMILNSEFLKQKDPNQFQVAFKRNLALAKIMGIDLTRIR